MSIIWFILCFACPIKTMKWDHPSYAGKSNDTSLFPTRFARVRKTVSQVKLHTNKLNDRIFERLIERRVLDLKIAEQPVGAKSGGICATCFEDFKKVAQKSAKKSYEKFVEKVFGKLVKKAEKKWFKPKKNKTKKLTVKPLNISSTEESAQLFTSAAHISNVNSTFIILIAILLLFYIIAFISGFVCFYKQKKTFLKKIEKDTRANSRKSKVNRSKTF